jgi:hypothetical protein
MTGSMSVSSTGSFTYQNFEELVETCTSYYRNMLGKAGDSAEVAKNRAGLAEWVQTFHRDCGTLSPRIGEAIDDLASGNCLVLMTAHQPNLFAYGGVMRKASVNQALADKLASKLGIPVVCFFGLADQDFTDDRWVRSAMLPDVERRDGTLELHVDLPEKMMLNKVKKPSRKVIDDWRSAVTDWIERSIGLASRSLSSLGVNSQFCQQELNTNFHDFWEIVQEAYEKAEVFSDFNSFVLSKVVNDVWGYPTLFSRFSQCQRVFEREFGFLLSRFDGYSKLLKEVTTNQNSSGDGVNEQESEIAPFWLHCECGSKARLMAEKKDGELVGHGNCLRCGKEYEINLEVEESPERQEYLAHVSARSVSMPLVLFPGLGVCCYVGGAGGQKYLRQANYVADGLGISFPPVVVWRPKDVYLGIGQLGALLTYKALSGTFELSQLVSFESQLKEKLGKVMKEVENLELQKKNISTTSQPSQKETIDRLKGLSIRQNEIRRENNFSLLSRNLKLVENVKTVLNLYPCMIDYAVNVGLKKTSDSWMAFLKDNGDLRSEVPLTTGLQDSVPDVSLKLSV